MTHQRIIQLPGIKNFRDMGGYTSHDGRPIKWGQLYRSGHFAEMQDDAVSLVAKRNISSVIDFRSPSELERQPAIWPAAWQPNYHSTPIGGNAAAWVRELYERLATAPFPATELREQFILAFETIPIANADGIKKLFDVLIDEHDDKAALFHCTAGKDRTGIAGGLIMTALNIDEDQIFEDFMLTNDAVDLEATTTHYAKLMSEKAGRVIAAKDVHPLVGVEPDFLRAALAIISKEYGSVDQYLTNAMGLTPERRLKLQARFLQD
ncbi:tyrosine-protein phosphatase [Kordiimonas aquimaris]|uniref:tyrosine-protein phosphatase n=1 Tax=Kordiimonas aquimaris TaxID=707591 RepID=UPI0021D32091|nr:tyrosine-protein phosphatase [Kordiimonas aquimaris]